MPFKVLQSGALALNFLSVTWSWVQCVFIYNDKCIYDDATHTGPKEVWKICFLLLCYSQIHINWNNLLMKWNKAMLFLMQRKPNEMLVITHNFIIKTKVDFFIFRINFNQPVLCSFSVCTGSTGSILSLTALDSL